MNRVTWIFGALLLFSAAAFAQVGGELPTGKVIDKVVVGADPSLSYALYLPKAYSPPKKYPVIYIFDPSAEGPSAAEVYREAAEMYGYILVASNDSRNGMDGGRLQAVLNGIWLDSNQRLSIDRTRVLAAGLSGGARVATAFAYTCDNCVFGVIGNGAGVMLGIKVTKDLPFMFYGTTGWDDYNYPEMRALQKKLDTLGIKNRVETFEGAHEWPPRSVVQHALEWYQIQLIRAGRLAKDNDLIDRLMVARAADADAYLKAGYALEAGRAYSSIVQDLAELRDTSAYAAKLKEIEASDDYKKALRSEQQQMTDQLRFLTDIIQLGNDLGSGSIEARAQIEDKIATMRRHHDDAKDSPDRRLSRRSIRQAFAETFQTSIYDYIPNRKFDIALLNLSLAGMISPKNPYVSYNEARVYAQKGDKKKALDALSRAIQLGFKDRARITAEQAFESIRQDPAFAKIVGGIGT